MRPTAKNTLTARLAMVIAAAMSPTITTNLAIVFRCSYVMMTKMLIAMTIEQRSASVAAVAALTPREVSNDPGCGAHCQSRKLNVNKKSG